MQKNAYTFATPEGEFTNGNPETGVPRSLMGADWLNTVQREGVAIVSQVGFTPTAGEDKQILQSVQLQIQTIAALKALPVPSASLRALAIVVQGYWAAGDGGGGNFYWNESSTAADNAGTVIRPSSLPSAGRWVRSVRSRPNVRWFGAKGDDTTNDSAAFLAAAAAAGNAQIRAYEGTYKLSSSVNLTTAGLKAYKGAIFTSASSATLTMTGGFEGSTDQHFAGNLVPVLNPAINDRGPIEWFGGIQGGADNLTAYNTAKTTLKTIKLRPGDYFFSAVVGVDVPYLKLKGHASASPGDAGGTRIVSTSATADIVRLGYATDPGTGVNNFCAGPSIEGIKFTRSTAPSAAANAVGLRNQYSIRAEVRGCVFAESIIPVKVSGAVSTKFFDCEVFRSAAASTGSDYCWGWYFDGNASIGLAGGNASCELHRCKASMGGAISAGQGSQIPSKALYMLGSYVDTFVNGFESAGFADVAHLYGVADDPTLTTRKNGNQDVRLWAIVGDAHASCVIKIEKNSEYGAIDIKGGYGAPVAGVATARGIYILNSKGLITISGFQAPHHSAGSNNRGLSIENSTGVMARGNMWTGATYPIILDHASNCSIEDAVNNPNETGASGMVYMDTCLRNYIRVTGKGGTSKFSQGYYLTSTASQYNELNCTGLDPAAISGGATNKLVVGGVGSVTTAGTFGTGNLASGVMT